MFDSLTTVKSDHILKTIWD